MSAALKITRDQSRPLHILIVDDHPVVAEGWGRIVKTRTPCEISSAASATEGWRAWRASRWQPIRSQARSMSSAPSVPIASS